MALNLLENGVFMHGRGFTVCFLVSFCVCHDGSDASLFSFLQAIFSSPDNVVSEAYAANPSLNQVSESYYGALKHQVNQSPSLLTSDLDSQSKPLANSIMKTPVDGNMPSDVPTRQNSLGLWKYLDDDISCLMNNPSSAVPITRSVIDEMPFHIIEISSEWAYCTDDTKVFFFFSFHPILSFHACLFLPPLQLLSSHGNVLLHLHML